MTAQTEQLRQRAAAELDAPFSPRKRPRMRSWIFFSLAVVVAFFGLIFSRISLDRSAFVLEELEREIAEEESRRGVLRVEVARLQDPDRISRLAGEMGLVYPAKLVSLDAPDEILPLETENPWARTPTIQAARR